MRPRVRHPRTLLIALVVAALVVAALAAGLFDGPGASSPGPGVTTPPVSGPASSGPSPGPSGAGTVTGPAVSPRVAPPPAAAPSVPPGMGVVTVAALPPEARRTLRLIDAGGPFPYDGDGAVFGNRERLLPVRPSGHYREYTVPTPGSPDRGARRVVTGRGGERYWTPDHYVTFAVIVP